MINVPKEIIVHVHDIVLILQKPSYGIRSPRAALNHLVNLRLKINFPEKKEEKKKENNEINLNSNKVEKY